MNKFNFVYITTNLVNGKQYVGDHSTDDLNDSYLGTGKIIKEAIKKYGKENFIREILELSPNKEGAFNAQEKYINEYNTLVPNGYNISLKGGLGINGCIRHSVETKEKMSCSQKQSYTIERRKKVSENNKKRIISDETKEKQRKSMSGKFHSKETKEKMKQSHIGKSSGMKGKHHTIETKEKISKNSASKLPETKEKISKGNKGKIRTEESRKNYSNAKRGIKLTDEHRKKLSKSRIEKGSAKGKNNPMYGKSLYSVWLEKYGEEIANEKYDTWKNKKRK